MAEWQEVLDLTVRTRWGPLVGYASLFTIDRGDAEDLVQEAVVRTFARRRDLRDPASAEAYLKAAVRTAFLDRTRRSKLASSRAHLFVADDVRGPEAGVVAGFDVAAALRVLRPRERACVVLRYFDDLPIADVAAELGLSEGAVKRYLSDAVGRLRELLGDGVAFSVATTERVATVASAPPGVPPPATPAPLTQPPTAPERRSVR
jgi:RNA polymerase sigma-70 factor (ECF subfamily)